MQDIGIVLERHEQKIEVLQKELTAMKEIQSEIRAMNEALVVLATEMKNTNEHLRRHEAKLDTLEAAPRARVQQVMTAVIAALATGLITAVIGLFAA